MIMINSNNNDNTYSFLTPQSFSSPFLPHMTFIALVSCLSSAAVGGTLGKELETAKNRNVAGWRIQWGLGRWGSTSSAFSLASAPTPAEGVRDHHGKCGHKDESAVWLEVMRSDIVYDRY